CGAEEFLVDGNSEVLGHITGVAHKPCPGDGPRQKHKSPSLSARAFDITGQLPTLPHTCACSTIGAEGLNFRVRDGNGWVPLARVTQNSQNPSLNIDGTYHLLKELTLYAE